MFSPGDSVVLVGLSQEGFNGRLAAVVRLETDSGGQSRVLVRLSDGHQILVRSSNLQRMEEYVGHVDFHEGKHGGQMLHLPSETDISTALLAFGYRKVKQHKIVSMGWVIGMLLAFLMYGFAPSVDQERKYQHGLQQVDHEALLKLEEKSLQAQAEYWKHRGWFSCDQACEEAKQISEAADREFAAATLKVHSQLSAAKAEVGVWSTYGVGEVRDLFWKRFSQGQGFAKRQSMWDAIFMGMSMGRDETLVSFIVRLLIQLIVNLTIGLFGATVAFLWSVWAVIKSYQPSGPEALIFFGMAALAAVSFVVSWLMGLYLAGAGTMYVIAKTVANSQRLEGPRRRRIRMHDE